MRRNIIVLSIISVITTASLLAQIGQDSSSAATKLTESREIVFQPELGVKSCDVVMSSPDGHFPAIMVMRGGKYCLMYRQYVSMAYDSIMGGRISPDGNRIAFFGYRGAGGSSKVGYFYLVVDDVVVDSFLWVTEEIFFSSNSAHYLCSGFKEPPPRGKAVIIIDGVKMTYDALQTPIPSYFSPDGNRIAYVAREGKENFVVLDGVEWKRYEKTGLGPIFSSDGKNVFCMGFRDDTCFAVIDNVEYGGYTDISEFIFSPDNKHCAYIATQNQDMYLVFDHRPIGPYQKVWEMSFSPDGSRFAYVACRGDSVFAIIDSIVQPAYKDVWKVLFSPDSKRYAYAVWLSLDSHHPRGAVVLDGQMGKIYNVIDVGSPLFSPDSRRFGYYAVTASSRLVAVVDGREDPEYQEIEHLVFSPDSKHYAYAGFVSKHKQTTVIDGIPGPTYTTVGDIAYSNNGQHWGYVAYDKKGYFIVVDGEESERFPKTFPFFRGNISDDRIIYYATDRQNRIVRVTLTPPAVE